MTVGSRIRIYLDDGAEPIADYEPPVAVRLNTHGLTDGKHLFRIEAHDRSGHIGMRELPFQVRNGPGITVSGIRADAIVHDDLNFTVNAFGAEEPFEPRRAESPSPIPVWVWVLSLAIVAWSAWYAAVLWKPPPAFANTPTYVQGTMWQH
ncbi:cytochrome C [Pusillimonas sp. ANT_WB101]|uniref:cytochrome C n=1 Tax=Pusillimonas sp. ANT_WB101 TaxID=2597356 RepID=UPI0011ED9C06|nr:cytochrome C [Pusillimonas sp. ANT_WB101]KAA0892718.1 cytochrome C [Pusillimonas sp. ANT_WB101]